MIITASASLPGLVEAMLGSHAPQSTPENRIWKKERDSGQYWMFAGGLQGVAVRKGGQGSTLPEIAPQRKSPGMFMLRACGKALS